VIVTTAIMSRQARQFYYQATDVPRRFSMMNLEWPSNRFKMAQVISGLQLRAEKAVKGQLYVDFAFMPGTYLGILILCMFSSGITSGTTAHFFSLLAWLQFLPWACDITENIYLFHKISKPAVPTPYEFVLYRLLEILKWGLSAGGFLLALIAMIIHFLKFN
jgi:hypothetical protein